MIQLSATHSDKATTKTAGATVQRVMLSAIVWYQGLRPGQPSPCRFFPTCSEFGYEAIDTHGALRGGWMTLQRLLRCRPFGPSGFDPVPLPHETAASAPTVCCDHLTKDC